MGLSKQFAYFISALVNKRCCRHCRWCCCWYCCCLSSSTVASYHITTLNVIHQSNRVRASNRSRFMCVYVYVFQLQVCGNHFVVVLPPKSICFRHNHHWNLVQTGEQQNTNKPTTKKKNNRNATMRFDWPTKMTTTGIVFESKDQMNPKSIGYCR